MVFRDTAAFPGQKQLGCQRGEESKTATIIYKLLLAPNAPVVSCENEKFMEGRGQDNASVPGAFAKSSAIAE